MFDVLVIGAGHAGCEAAAAAARRGARVGLLTFRTEDLGQMSCNPSIGGVGKGHLVRELDVFDGLMATAADRSAIHRRMLNRSKGPAVRGPRIQADRQLYCRAIQNLVLQSGASLITGEAARLALTNGRVSGVHLGNGDFIACRALVIATGTFLDARIFIGETSIPAGRRGEAAATMLGAQIRELGLGQGRLKTGTPPRLDGRTIDWCALKEQPSDSDTWSMSAMPHATKNPQLRCGITRTTSRTHDIIRSGFSR